MNCTREQSAELVEKYWEREWELIKAVEFPPVREHPITLEDCRREWKKLCSNGELTSKSNSRIVRYFHGSIIHAAKGGHDSPYLYWQKLKKDPELFKAFYENRLRCSDWFKEKDGLHQADLWEGRVPMFIYGIGLTTSMKAPVVSYFKPGVAKHLINAYLPDKDTVFDAFAGYSGRLLGAAACGKKYIGYDINDLTVAESNEVKDFIGADASIEVRDSLSCSESFAGAGFLSCPPYSDASGKQIETWTDSHGVEISCGKTCDQIIEYVLDCYRCDRYVFVVDGSSRAYDRYVREYIVNDNYINARNGGKPGKNMEKVIVI